MNGHTPSPWEWDGPDIYGPGYITTVMEVAVHCGTWCLGGSPVVRMSDEDKRLMVAAPDMLEVLQTIENDAGQVPAWLWDKIQAAIAKATGVQP